MSEVKRYSCTVLVDASTGFNVEAISPEEAAEKAENLAAESGATSICHQCSANLEVGDFFGVMVYDEDLGEQVLDTTYGAEQIARLILERDALAAQRDEGLAREAVMQKQLGELWKEISALRQSIESASTERDALQQRLAEAEKAKLTVWEAAMPESNVKSNFTAILMRKGGELHEGMTIARSEYPGRVRYEADEVRWLIGELAERPFILDYNTDEHSGFSSPGCADGEKAE